MKASTILMSMAMLIALPISAQALQQTDHDTSRIAEHKEFIRGCRSATQYMDDQAYTLSGNEDSTITIACIAYVNGISEGFAAAGKVTVGGVQICVDAKATPGRIIRRIVSLDTDDPQHWEKASTRITVIAALAQLYPCNKL
jgi:hypothetical protein